MIAYQDTVTSFLLAGVGNVDLRRRTNYLIVDSKTTAKAIKDAFKQFTTREDIAIVLISHYVANMIRFVVDSYNKPVPAILEIPSKDHPYDLAHDSVLSLSSLLNPWLQEGIEYPFNKFPLVALIAASEEQTVVSAFHSDNPLALCYL